MKINRKYILFQLLPIFYSFLALIVFSTCTSNSVFNLVETEKTFYNYHDFKPCRTILVTEKNEIFAINYFSQTNKRIEINNLENNNKIAIKIPEYIEAQILHAEKLDTVILFNNHICYTDG